MGEQIQTALLATIARVSRPLARRSDRHALLPEAHRPVPQRLIGSRPDSDAQFRYGGLWQIYVPKCQNGGQPANAQGLFKSTLLRSFVAREPLWH